MIGNIGGALHSFIDILLLYCAQFIMINYLDLNFVQKLC